MVYEIKCRQCGSVMPGTAINCPNCDFAVGLNQGRVSAIPSGLVPLFARLLAYFSLGFALFVYSITRLGFEPFGYEVTLAIAGLCIWLCILSATASIIVSAIQWLKGRSVGLITCVLPLIALVLVCASIYWPG